MAYFSRFDDYLYLRWSREVKVRDHYSCVICGERSKLNSHHLNAWASFPDERYDLDNGVTLCEIHHEMFHDIYGKGKNTKEQFEDYSKAIKLMMIEAAFQVRVENAAKKALALLKSHEITKKILEDHDGYDIY